MNAGFVSGFILVRNLEINLPTFVAPLGISSKVFIQISYKFKFTYVLECMLHLELKISFQAAPGQTKFSFSKGKLIFYPR